MSSISGHRQEQALQNDLDTALEKKEQQIAGACGITEEKELQRIYHIALLHDIGKIAIPDGILKKSQSLSDDEFAIMKTHTVLGEKILHNLTFLPDASLGAIYHHEKPDGTGYPKGLKNDQIPFIAKIISVADSLDAMNSSRVYRKNCSKEFIIGNIYALFLIAGTELFSVRHSFYRCPTGTCRLFRQRFRFSCCISGGLPLSSCIRSRNSGT